MRVKSEGQSDAALKICSDIQDLPYSVTVTASDTRTNHHYNAMLFLAGLTSSLHDGHLLRYRHHISPTSFASCMPFADFRRLCLSFKLNVSETRTNLSRKKCLNLSCTIPFSGDLAQAAQVELHSMQNVKKRDLIAIMIHSAC